MASPGQTDIEKKIALLQDEFKRTLPVKVENIEALWNSILEGEANESAIDECHRMVHTLAGSGGTFGAAVVTTVSQELIQAIKSVENKNDLTLDNKSIITDLILKLKTVANDWSPSKAPCFQPLGEKMKGERKGNLIYLAEDDELVAAELITQLEHDDFVVKHFTDLNDFANAFSDKIPSAIIMDVMFKEGDIAGADAIAKLKNKNEFCPPIIFIADRNDIEARLAAVKAGAQRYFTKPLNTKKLSKTLDGLIERKEIKPFRILFVDDDVNLLKYYEAVVDGAGMEVKTISSPMDSLNAIEEFNPDVIVLDIYMPECSGPEVAQVIRQDDRWALTPIMFLSTETDLDVQLDSMNLGGEMFMVKPIAANHLISVLNSKAKTSRWSNRLNHDLEKVIRENEYQIVTSNLHDIVSTSDISGRIVSVNDKFCEVSGYSRDELIGNNHRILKSNVHPDSFYDDMWKTISSGKVWHGSVCNFNKAGEQYWVESTIVPFLDDKGKPYKYVSARTDITSVIQSEERLERSQKFANIGTWDWNIETDSLFWSEGIWPLFGYKKEVTETTYDNFMSAIHPDERQLVADAILSCIENGEDYDVEHRVVWPDGSIHWLHERGDVVCNKNEKPIHMLGVVQDITNRKLAEQSLIDALEEAETANRAKSQFLSSMSHELRTPMNAIMGFGQLLVMEIENPLNASQKENVSEILKASDHLLELINEVLDLAKIEAGRIDLSIEDVQVGSVIIESLQLILPLAEKRGISIKLLRGDTEVSLSDLFEDKNIVRADHTRMKQVIINLLSNAVKYNVENGAITIKCNKADNQNLRVSITDTGKGLTQEQSEQLFTAFNRLGAENTEVEGTGIGLVITKNIVELMGGSIGVESESGVGSTFWFELPGSSDNFEGVNNTALAEIKIDLEEARTVLYIEDNPANLRLVTQLLSRLPNIHMWSAHEPKLGLELAAEHRPDLILLDINLPGMDGFEVLKKLKLNDGTCETPVIAISANAMPKDIKKGAEAGFADYITKPIDISAFLVAVDDKLKNKS